MVQLNGASFAAKDNFYLTFDAAETMVSGKGDCNSLNGKYTMAASDNKLSFGMLVSTRMFCQQQDKEDQFMQMLGKVDSYDVDGDLLLLLAGSEVVAVLQAQGK